MTHTKPPYPLNPRHTLICLLMLTAPLAVADTKHTAGGKKITADNSTEELSEITVTEKIIPTAKNTYKLPNTTESITREKIDNTINAFNVEDALKYLPSIQSRKLYIGERNSLIGGRTSGPGLTARGLIYADGILLSSLLGTGHNGTGAPRWNIVSPSEIERIDVLYGPFSAAYPGNSIGGVIDITTRLPEKFEAGGEIKSAWQDYNRFGSKRVFDSQIYSFNVGNRYKDLSFRFDVSHIDSNSHPQTLVNPIVSATTPGVGTPVTGAIANQNAQGVDALVLGAAGLNHTVQDNFKWKLGYDLTPTIHAAYTLGLWQNDANAGFDSFLRDGAGNVVNSGNVNIGGRTYSLNGSFVENRNEQTHWSHGINLKSDTGGVFDWNLSGSVIEFGTDLTRNSTQTPAQAANNGPGRVTSLSGSGWQTADAKGIWRPAANLLGSHELSFGFHHDLYNLDNRQFNVTNWQTSNDGSISSDSQGKTQTEGYWLQDAWDINQNWNLTVGGRLENWHAFDGSNAATVGSGAATRLIQINQSNRNDLEFSPKAKLTWKPVDRIQTGLAIGQAYRFATATELFQTTTLVVNGVTNIINSNPNLKPEEALSSELSGEYFLDNGKLRLSLFQERVKDAIYSQRSLLADGRFISTPKNVGETQTYGIEFAGEASDVGIQGIDLSGNVTWTDSRITENAVADAVAAREGPTAANPNANQPSTGRRQPGVPEWRANATIAYRPTDKLTASVSGRYSSSRFNQLNNSDTNIGANASFGSNGNAFFFVDLRTKYQITKQVSVAAGIDNVNNEEAYAFHPFPSRTYFAELKYNY